MLDAEATRYCNQIEKLANMEPAPYVNATTLTLHVPLLEMLQDGLTLLEGAGPRVTKAPNFYGAWSMTCGKSTSGAIFTCMRVCETFHGFQDIYSNSCVRFFAVLLVLMAASK